MLGFSETNLGFGHTSLYDLRSTKSKQKPTLCDTELNTSILSRVKDRDDWDVMSR